MVVVVWWTESALVEAEEQFGSRQDHASAVPLSITIMTTRAIDGRKHTEGDVLVCGYFSRHAICVPKDMHFKRALEG